MTETVEDELADKAEERFGPLPDRDQGLSEPERFPGGADSVADEEKYGDLPDDPLARDLPTGSNPAVQRAPDEVTEPDDKQQEPDGDTAAEDEPAD